MNEWGNEWSKWKGKCFVDYHTTIHKILLCKISPSYLPDWAAIRKWCGTAHQGGGQTLLHILPPPLAGCTAVESGLTSLNLPCPPPQHLHFKLFNVDYLTGVEEGPQLLSPHSLMPSCAQNHLATGSHQWAYTIWPVLGFLFHIWYLGLTFL